MKLLPLFLCLLVWHQVDGAKNYGNKPNSRLLSWAKNGALVLTINYAMHANANSNANEIACPFTVPEANKMEKMYWIACAQKETDLEKYLVGNPEKTCPEVRTLYSKVKTWVIEKAYSAECFATQPKSILDAAISSFKRENKKPTHQEQLTLFEDYLKTCQDDLWQHEGAELMKIAEHDNEFDFFAMRSFERFYFLPFRNYAKNALKRALENYKSADYDQVNKAYDFLFVKMLTGVHEAAKDLNWQFHFKRLFKDEYQLDPKLILRFTDEYAAAKKALYSKYQDLNFDQVNKAYDFLDEKMFADEYEAAIEAMDSKYQDLDFDQVNKAFDFLYGKMFTDKHVAAKEALDSKYQDLNFDQVNKAFHFVYGEMLTKEFAAAQEEMDSKYHWLVQTNKFLYKSSYPGSKRKAAERALKSQYDDIKKRYDL